MSSKSNITDTLNQVLRYALGQFNVCLPAVVVSYDFRTQKASVQPQIKKQYLDGQSDIMPVIPSVPVIFPRSGDASITLPVAVGDTVLCLFADRSIVGWLERGGYRNPNDRRMHSLNDAIAIPGLISFAAGSKADNNEDILIKNDATSVRLKPSGEVQIDATAKVTVNTPDVTVNADAVTVNAPETTLNGNLTVNGFTTTVGIASTVPGGGIGASISGDVEVTGTVQVTGDVEADGISLNSHTHSGVQTGGGNTGGPQ